MKQNGKTINSYFIFIILLLLVIFGLNLLNNRTDEYTKAEFIADLDAGNVSEVVVQPNGEAPTGYLEIQMKNGVSHKLYATDITELETLVREYGFDPVVNDIERENWFLTYMLPMLVVLAVGIFLFMMMNAQQAGGGNGKMMNFGKSRAKMTLGDKSVTFAQVAGLKEEKEELEEIVDFLKEPGKYTGVGARIPKGVLLEGPPGTGKTLLAKAVAGEAGVPFFSISGSDFVEMFVGVGASRVRDLFEEAKHNAPCIVFIDEIDAVARRRGTGMVASGGELSRIMLAIKTVLAETDQVPTLIFDEIDTGISGRTAQMVSEKLRILSKCRQVICITHLPQIAAMADQHFEIRKSASDGRTATSIRALDREAMVDELARLLGGAEITETVRQNAEEMKKLAKKRKLEV